MMVTAAAGDPPPTVDIEAAVHELHKSDFRFNFSADCVLWASGTQFAQLRYLEAGFPFRSFSGSVFMGSKLNTTDTQGLLEIGRSGQDNIPINPHWPALLANATAWSIALWTVSLCPFALRRFIRRRRGLCPHCAYNLSATPPTAPCPECGTITKSRQPT